jgi:hypothetical protein
MRVAAEIVVSDGSTHTLPTSPFGKPQRADHPTQEHQGEMTQRSASSAYRSLFARPGAVGGHIQ